LLVVEFGTSFECPVGMSGETSNVAWLYGIIGWPGPTTKTGGLIVEQRLIDTGAVVHDEGSVLGDRLTDGSALEYENLCAGGPGRHSDRDGRAGRRLRLSRPKAVLRRSPRRSP
jgi:hypothetical protein